MTKYSKYLSEKQESQCGKNLSFTELQLLAGKVITFYFYHADHALAHEDHCRSDSQSGFLLVRTLPKVKIGVLFLFPLKKIKWEGKMEFREGMGNNLKTLMMHMCPIYFLEGK